jgi:hypothetical protein
MFQSVEVSNLCYNCTYKIVADDEYVGVYKGKFWHPDLYLEFDHIRNISGHFQPPKYFLPTRKFYKFISQKARIQSDMERRAVNLIVRRVLGDDCFQW